MSANHHTQLVLTPADDMEPHLTYLQLAFIAQHYAPLATQAAQHAWSHVAYLARLLEGEANVRRDRATSPPDRFLTHFRARFRSQLTVSADLWR